MIVIEDIDETHQPSRTSSTARARAKAEDYGLVRNDGFAFAFPAAASRWST